MSTKREQQVTGYEVTAVSRLVGNLLSVCFYYVNREVVTEVTSCYGKLTLGVKSLFLLVLTNLPTLTPYRGYRGVVSNPPPPTYFFSVQYDELFGLDIVQQKFQVITKKEHLHHE